MKICIFGGTGSVGGVLATQLATHNQVAIIGRPNSHNLQIAIEEGIGILTEIEKRLYTPNNFAYIGEFTEEIGIQDLIIISVKQPDLDYNLIQQVKKISGSNTLVAIITNGIPFYFKLGLIRPQFESKYIDAIDPNGKILESLHGCKIVALHPIIAANIEILGTIKVSRPLDKILFTLSTPYGFHSQSAVNIQSIIEVFQKNKLQIKSSSISSHYFILEKLQFTMSINVLSAILEKNLGDVFNDFKSQTVIKYVIDFCNALALSYGIKDLRDYEQFKKLEVTKTHFSSIYTDIAQNKPTELNAILNAPLELYETQYKKGKVFFPDIAPLKMLKALLEKKISQQHIEDKDLDNLFNQCAKATLAFTKFKAFNLIERSLEQGFKAKL
jgi:ketopantoate reductase